MLHDADFNDQLFQNQIVISLLFLFSGLGILYKVEPKNIMILSVIAMTVSLFWFVGNVFIMTLDEKVD